MNHLCHSAPSALPPSSRPAAQQRDSLGLLRGALGKNLSLLLKGVHAFKNASFDNGFIGRCSEALLARAWTGAHVNGKMRRTICSSPRCGTHLYKVTAARKEQRCNDSPSVTCLYSARSHPSSLADLRKLGKRMYLNRCRFCCRFSGRMAYTLLHTPNRHATVAFL